MQFFQFAQKAKHRSVITGLITLITFSLYAAQSPAKPDPASLYSKATGAPPNQVIEYYNRHDTTTTTDHFTLATAYYANCDFLRALDSANRALSGATDETAKSICYQLVAQCHGALGNYNLALESAVSGSRRNPHSAELAALRIAYAHQDGDKLAEAAASDHLMRLDPNYARSPKCDPITAGVIVVAIVCATYTCVVKSLVDAKNPEVAKAIVGSLKDLLQIASPKHLLKEFTVSSSSK